MKNKTINQIIEREGGYVNDPSDSGGETNFGITVAVAREYGYDGAMVNLTRQTAFRIYDALYWTALRADDLAKVSNALAAEVVDTGVNMGTGRAGEFLQRALNAVAYESLTVDGQIGPATIAAVRRHAGARKSVDVLLKALNCLQGAFYIELSERREKDKKFVYGWISHRVKL